MKIVELVKDFILNKFWYHYPKSIRYSIHESLDEFKELVEKIHNDEDYGPLRITQDVRGNYQIWKIDERKTNLGFLVKEAEVIALYNVKLERMKYSTKFVREIGTLYIGRQGY